ncbi:HNH endonuclease [Massilia aquatica]|uniref:HNH endonuclease n=1 Tax=Massilia aquatica TaxID=2609000 RepID=A0ABX0MAU4_9BURK|nr:hypothetical protein [Massilia aquatica]NHZ41372.1 hypothetical protein [Massilia aquatica]
MANPTDNGGDVYVLCVSSIDNLGLRANLISVTNKIGDMCTAYVQIATRGNLYQLPQDHSDKEATYLGSARKKDFTNVYSNQMVAANKPGRAIYDRILGSAPGGKCPLCGFGQAKTLDHYLPKSKYPQFAVFPSNLVPACYECNVGKRNGVAIDRVGQSIHPYFDHLLINEQWLFARVVPDPFTIEFSVEPPRHWERDDGDRVRSHFSLMDLEKRFNTEATDELAAIHGIVKRNVLQYGFTAQDIREDLLATAAERHAIQKNSWQTALYQALGNSDWYCREGYQA